MLLTHTTYEHGKECSETSAHKMQSPGNHPNERIRHSEYGESLKSRKTDLEDVWYLYCAGDKIEKNEMGMACGTYGRRESCAQGFGGET